MAAHQLKRSARNRLVPRCPDRYLQSVTRDAERLSAPVRPALIDSSVADLIHAFYEVNAAAMDAAGRGEFTLYGRTVDFGSIAKIDWTHRLPEESDHHLWRMKLNQLEVVHSLLASGGLPEQQVALKLLDHFDTSRFLGAIDAFGTSWSPYGTSHRLLATLSGLALADRIGCLSDDVRDRCTQFCALDAAFVWRNIEHDLRNNHTERNLAALTLFHTATGDITPGQVRILGRDIAGLVEATVLPDGTQVERSAMYQGLTVMSLRIFEAAPFLSDKTRQLVATRRNAAESAWRFLTHEDGDISLFNDSWTDEVPQIDRVTCRSPVNVDALPDGGYFRVASGSVAALLDAGPIGPRWNPGHGHADFLAVELDVLGERLVVDPGTSQYSTGETRARERSAASHNGPVYNGVEPVTYAGSFKVGQLAEATALDASRLSAIPGRAVGGQLSTKVGRVQRILAALPSGGLVMVDEWSAPTPQGRVRLLFPATWMLSHHRSGGVLATVSPSGASCLVEVLSGSLHETTPSLWCRRFMNPEPAWAVDLTPDDRAGAFQRLEIAWGVERSTEAQDALAAIDAVLSEAEGR